MTKYLRHWKIEDDAIDASLYCIDQARELCDTMSRSERGWFLCGPQGRGKTTLAAAMLRVELERFLLKKSPYRSIQFVFIPNLLLELQSCFGPNSEKMPGDVIHKIAEYDFLVLDGFGEGGKQTHFVTGALGTIIHHREAERKKKRTIVTSNYTAQELSEITDARIVSRISGMCEIIPFTGKDRRLHRRDGKAAAAGRDE